MGEYMSFVDGLLARLHGPMSFRFIMQPAMALFLAARDGMRDAREGRAPFFWGLLTGDAAQRRGMLASGWKSISKVFLIALALDLVFQLVVRHAFHLVGALLAGAILALVPYVLLRGPANRLARLAVRGSKP